MRLINIDEIDVFHQNPEDVVFDIIHAIPFDAIPIDFIDEWIIELQGIYADDIEENISNKFIAVTLQALKYKWRKENESNDM